MGWDVSQLEPILKKLTQNLPTGFIADGDHIAYAILFLASEESSYITGSNLVSDGGSLAANVPAWYYDGSKCIYQFTMDTIEFIFLNNSMDIK